MKILIVGGTFGDKPKESQIVNKLFKHHAKIGLDGSLEMINGGSYNELKNISLIGFDLIYWLTNIENSFEKVYPKKDKGSILIVSKVLRENRTEIDAISRIFTMHGNGVIAINTSDILFNFKLIDALGNVWSDSTDLEELVVGINKLAKWSIRTKRIKSSKVESVNLDKFIELNERVADKFEKVKGRYFGNLSTRCSLMFPSARNENSFIYVSKRNVSKKRLSIDDMVLAFSDYNKEVKYVGNNKPSVDTPIQLKIFNNFQNINYIIHGHTYIKDAEFTSSYYPCGDVREYGEISSYLLEEGCGQLNLINHGFIIYADTIQNLEILINDLNFYEREIGFEKINKHLIL